MTQFRYDGRSFLDTATLAPFPGRPEQLTTSATYSSEGLLHHRSTDEPRNPTSPRNAPDRFTQGYVLTFSGRPVGIYDKLEETTLGGQVSETTSLTYLTTDHLGTPVLATNAGGSDMWGGGFEPFGADYSAAQQTGMFLRFPGQWENEVWEGASDGESLYFNVHRWYEHETGRYTRLEPINIGLTMNGVDLSSFDFAPNVTAQINTMRLIAFDKLGGFLYVKGGPTYWVDPLGLSPCDVDPRPLVGCQQPGSGCCLISCISDLRAQLCSWKKAKTPLTVVGGVAVGGAAVLAAPATAGVGTVCILGAAGFVAGASGGYFGLEAVIPFEAFRQTFKNCVQNRCGVVCSSEDRCFADRQFDLTRSEVFP